MGITVTAMVTKILGGRKTGKLFFKEWLEKRELSAERFADRVEVERQTVYRWINGERRPRPEYYDKIVQALDLSGFSDLYRPPHRPSIDAVTANLPDDMHEDVLDFAVKLAKRRAR